MLHLISSAHTHTHRSYLKPLTAYANTNPHCLLLMPFNASGALFARLLYSRSHWSEGAIDLGESNDGNLSLFLRLSEPQLPKASWLHAVNSITQSIHQQKNPFKGFMRVCTHVEALFSEIYVCLYNLRVHMAVFWGTYGLVGI